LWPETGPFISTDPDRDSRRSYSAAYSFGMRSVLLIISDPDRP
jgi:hypothetical protein